MLFLEKIRRMQDEKFQLKVNGKWEFEQKLAHASELDVVSFDDRHFHILKDGKSYRAEVLNFDFPAKTASIRVNGEVFQVEIEDHFDLLVKKMGLTAAVHHKINQVKAPMPGLVLSIAVEPGQEVVRGDVLMILEAMKMENVLKSPGEGRVKKILVQKGKPVDKGELLLEFE